MIQILRARLQELEKGDGLPQTTARHRPFADTNPSAEEPVPSSLTTSSIFAINLEHTVNMDMSPLTESAHFTESLLHAAPKGGAAELTRQSNDTATVVSVASSHTFGSLFSTRSLEDNTTRAESIYRMAQGINILEIMDDEVGIEPVQVGLLMANYLQSTERLSKCWNVAGLAIRMAQNMGLHFEVAEARKRELLAPFSTQLEAEIRTRVWYECVLLDT